MKQEKRLLRCISWIDDELLLEAEQTRFPSLHLGRWLALAACLALILTVPLLGQIQPKSASPEAARTEEAANAAGTPNSSANKKSEVSAEPNQKPQTKNDITATLDTFPSDEENSFTEEEPDGSAMPEPLPYNLIADEIIIYRQLKVWDSVLAIDKAAKGISIVLTISEPEPVTETPESPLDRWLDLGNGTAIALLGDDIASIYTYEDFFDIENTAGLTWHVTGRFPDLDDYVQRAWDNPTMTWDLPEASYETAPTE